MILQQIVETLDKELERLERLREIVSDLSHSADVILLPDFLPTQNEVPLQAKPEESEKEKSTRRRISRRAAVPPTPPEDSQKVALAGQIPAAPVVVTAAALARENEAKALVRSRARAEEPVREPGTLGAMIRALGLKGAV